MELTRLDAALGFMARALPASGPVVVGVSGGSDSAALLHLMVDVFPGRVIAATVDHRLRDGSGAEAREVACWCAALGVPHRCLEWTAARPGPSLQDRARQARFHLLTDLCRRLGGPADAAPLVLAHTRDDAAETFLMRLFHDSGPLGLAAIARESEVPGAPPVRVLRPLLGVSRRALRDYLGGRGAAWLDDPSNLDPRFERVRWRAALPRLGRAGADEAQLAATADVFARVKALADGAAAGWLAAQAQGTELGWVRLERAALAGLPSALRSHILRRLIWSLGGGAYPIAPDRAECLADAVVAPGFKGETLGGCRLAGVGEGILAGRELRALRGAGVAVRPGEAVFWDNRWVVLVPLSAPEGLVLRALGPVAREMRAQMPLAPRAWAHHGLPGLWQADGLVAAPGWTRKGWAGHEMPVFAFLGNERVFGGLCDAYRRVVPAGWGLPPFPGREVGRDS